MKKKSIKQRSNLFECPGFTLVETMVALVLVLIGVMFVAKITIFTLDSYKKSFLRLTVLQKIQFHTQSLISKSYGSSELNEGKNCKHEHPFEIRWSVYELSPTLKKISISVQYDQLVYRSYFYKSKHINRILSKLPFKLEIPCLSMTTGYQGEA
ncbi:MAG: prepilin-type N-terminal cleavage/methylation domain-containing protein [Candidatus Aminicenantes bacterium]|nr:prepilin-type N-terminal cleavage/methylation domain-containing protein [Candidatus Aminicenantes bacterium]